jgi:CelD/BcsL family acetyltransferase involved in cellulose biosynthesis
MVCLIPVSRSDEWDKYLKEHPRATLFHTRSWLQSIGQLRGYSVQWMRLMAGRQCVGLFPFFLTRRGPLRMALSCIEADGTHMGPLLGSASYPEALDAFHAWCRRHLVSFSVVCSREQATDMAAGANRGSPHAQRIPKSTYLVDLGGTEAAVFKRCKKRFQETVRKAQRRGVELHPWTVDRLPQHNQLLDAVAKRNGFKPVFGPQQLAVLVRQLRQAGQLSGVTATVSGKLVGSLILGNGPAGAYGISSAADQEHQHRGVYSAMYWRAFEQARGQGLQYFDFTGAGSASLVDYKRSCGAFKQPLCRQEFYYNSAALLARRLYARSRKRSFSQA